MLARYPFEEKWKFVKRRPTAKPFYFLLSGDVKWIWGTVFRFSMQSYLLNTNKAIANQTALSLAKLKHVAFSWRSSKHFPVCQISRKLGLGCIVKTIAELKFCCSNLVSDAIAELKCTERLIFIFEWNFSHYSTKWHCHRGCANFWLSKWNDFEQVWERDF